MAYAHMTVSWKFESYEFKLLIDKFKAFYNFKTKEINSADIVFKQKSRKFYAAECECVFVLPKQVLL